MCQIENIVIYRPILAVINTSRRSERFSTWFHKHLYFFRRFYTFSLAKGNKFNKVFDL